MISSSLRFHPQWHLLRTALPGRRPPLPFPLTSLCSCQSAPSETATFVCLTHPLPGKHRPLSRGAGPRADPAEAPTKWDTSECQSRLVYLAIPWCAGGTTHSLAIAAWQTSPHWGHTPEVPVEPSWLLQSEPAPSRTARHPSGCPGLPSRQSTDPDKETWPAAPGAGSPPGGPRCLPPSQVLRCPLCQAAQLAQAREVSWLGDTGSRVKGAGRCLVSTFGVGALAGLGMRRYFRGHVQMPVGEEQRGPVPGG